MSNMNHSNIIEMLSSTMTPSTTNQTNHSHDTILTTYVGHNNEEYEQNVIVLIIVSLLITIPNSLVILTFITNKCVQRRPANVLICSQACIDLFSGIIYIPTFLIELYYERNDVTRFLTCYVLFVSLFNLLALSTDRYLALYKPLLHYRVIDLQRTLIVILFIWFIPLCLTIIPLIWWFRPLDFKHTAGQYYLGVVWLFMLVLVIAMTILYLCVTKKARRTIRSKRRSMTNKSRTKMIALARKELRVVHLFGLLLFFFVAAYLPILYMNFCDILDKVELIPKELETIGFYSLFLNSFVNPILCIYLKKDYLRAFTKLTCFKLALIQKFNSYSRKSTKLLSQTGSNSNQFETEVNDISSSVQSRQSPELELETRGLTEFEK